jgi:nicotinate-nucleotide adenylyltransferase
MKIGLFGGTFNPIHRGHLAIAKDVLAALSLDKILFIPTGHPPHKADREVIPAEHRLEMVRLAVRGRPAFEVSDLEVLRSGKSYTIQTVEDLRKDVSDGRHWYLIMGLDAFLDFPKWREPDRLASLCHLVVVSRPGLTFRGLAGHPFVKEADPGELDRLDGRRLDRYELELTSATRLILLCVSDWDISATEIRNHLSGKNRKTDLLPEAVESYIMKHRLYIHPK